MRTLKNLLFLLLAPICFAQTPSPVIPNPPCVLNFSLNASGASPSFKNSAPACDKWTLTVHSTGFSAFTLTLESAPAATSTTPGTFASYAGATATGSNPVTAAGIATFTNGTVDTPYLRVNLSGLTGSGLVWGVLQGALTLTSKSSAGGGGGPTITGNANRITAIGAGCTSPSTATCNIDIPANPILNGVATAGGFASGEAASGNLQLNGLTSGNVTLAVNDVAGTAIAYVWPSTNGAAGQVIEDSGAATCPTLPAGAPATCHQLIWTTAPSGTAGGGVLGYSSLTSSLPTAGTTFFPPVGGGEDDATESNVTAKAPAAAAISNMYVTMNLPPGAGNTMVFTYRDAGSSTALQCTISGASATSCQDIIHSFTPSVGDALSIQVVTTGTVIITPTIRIIAEYGVTGGGGGAVSSVGGLTGAVPGGWILLEQHTASSSASLAFTTCFNSSYDDYKIEVVSIVLGSSTTFGLRASTNGGASYDSGSNYSWTSQFATCCVGASGFFGTANDNQFYLRSPTASPDLSGNYPIQGSYTLYDPLGSAFKFFQGSGFAKADGDPAGPTLISINGAYLINTAVNAIQFLPGTGTITSGTIRCYGAAKQ